MQMRKMIKWTTKLAIKRNAKGKRREREKNIEIDSQKKKEIWLMRMPEKQKSRLITSS